MPLKPSFFVTIVVYGHSSNNHTDKSRNYDYSKHSTTAASIPANENNSALDCFFFPAFHTNLLTRDACSYSNDVHETLLDFHLETLLNNRFEN